MKNLGDQKVSLREKIIEVATRLFNEQGVLHTGNEQIIAESHVAKMTFYKYFPTKSKLIAEYLTRRDERWFEILNRHTMKASLSPTEKILAIFEALEEWFKDPSFYGCPFIRGLSDFDETDDPKIQNCISSHFEKTSNFIFDILKETKIKHPENLVTPLLSLISGAIVVAHATRSHEVSIINKNTAKLLLENAS